MIIHDTTIVTVDDKDSVHFQAAILIEGDRIAAIGPSKELLQRHPQASVMSRTLETGCNVATESGVIVYRVTGKRKGTRMLLGGRYVTQYRFEDGAWRIGRHILDVRPIASRALI